MQNESKWRAVAAAVRGASHVKSETPCQDAVQWSASGEWLIAAVADGAGSARESERGAKLATDAAARYLQEKIGSADKIKGAEAEKILKDALVEARAAVLAEAKIANLLPRDFATTLLLVLLSAETAAAVQVGDGAVIVRGDDGELVTLTKPPSAEYLNETTFITADDALETAQVANREGRFSGGAVFTDGLQMLGLKMPDAIPHAPFFAPLFKYLESEVDLAHGEEKLREFLTSPKITQRADDDLTLLLALLKTEA
jgi:hypothetical protein